MRDFANLKSKAQKLHGKGKTYTEIQTILGKKIPKSTLSYWCKNIALPQWYNKKIQNLKYLNLSRAQKMAWLANKAKQETILKDIYAKNYHLSKKVNDKDTAKMLLAMLYLGEGSKRKAHRGLRLGNSDPSVVQLYLKLLKHCFGILPKIMKCQIIYRADQNLTELKRYWSGITHIPFKNFYTTAFDPRTKGKPTLQKNYKGVCVISCAGADRQLELETIPKIILNGFGAVV